MSGFGRDVWVVGTVVVIGTVGTILATTTINLTLAALSADLHAEVHVVQWVATAYVLGLAATISTTGWLARRAGARRVYLISLSVFAVASAICALATSIEMLIVFRVLQGVAGGAALPVGMMMLASVAGPERMSRVMSIVGVPMVIGPIVGPTIAGVLVDELSWRWVFLMNVPLSLGAVALGARLLPQMPARAAGPFDVVGFALIVTGIPAFVYGLASTGDGGGLGEPQGIGAIAAGLALIFAFVVHAWRSRHPLLDVRLWKSLGFSACALTALLISGALFSSLMLLPLSFQAVRDASATTAGLFLAPQGIGAASMIAISGRLSDRIGAGHVAFAGVAILAFATVPLVYFDRATPTWVICAVLFVRGVGMGGSITPAISAAYSHVRPDQVPDATPQLNVLQRLGGAIAGTVVMLALAGGLPDGTITATHAQAAHAFHQAFLWSLMICVLALLPALILARLDRRPRMPTDVDGERVSKANLELAAT